MQPAPHLLTAIVGGLVGTAAMTLVAYVPPAFGVDFAGLLGGVIAGAVPDEPGRWLLGMVVHLVNGAVVFPLLYALLLSRVLPGPPWARGMLFGAGLWVLAQAILVPPIGHGAPPRTIEQPWLTATWNLVAHLVYGATLGAIASPRVSRAVERERREQGGRAA
ncbi:MAG TPA: DUF6789 family protein [Candidatus Tectomicrobia bacterium]|nr:DUF6789 family protein [Candidatus Tectomicrobia bacterium]